MVRRVPPASHLYPHPQARFLRQFLPVLLAMAGSQHCERCGQSLRANQCYQTCYEDWKRTSPRPDLKEPISICPHWVLRANLFCVPSPSQWSWTVVCSQSRGFRNPSNLFAMVQSCNLLRSADQWKLEDKWAMIYGEEASGKCVLE